MRLAIFDLDNTLIGGDSDTLWGEYLVEKGIYDAGDYGRAHRRFYQDYLEGKLDIQAFLRFQMRVLGEHAPETLHTWRAEFLAEKIAAILLPQARELVAWHREQGHRLLIITATNRFITEPIAALFGIEDLIATEPEIREGRYTGLPTGVPSYAEGKVARFRAWLGEQVPNETWFYSDSRNDIPLLQTVTHPVAVDPDPALAAFASARGWRIISLREKAAPGA
jgi:HAD superfamily hydrolase (TIGR01490 family)